MTEFIMPMKHTGEDGNFICVGFAGLNRDTYDKLELSIDGSSFISTTRNPDNAFFSLPISFYVPHANINYEVIGRITIGDTKEECQTKMPSIHWDHTISDRKRPKTK